MVTVWPREWNLKEVNLAFVKHATVGAVQKSKRIIIVNNFILETKFSSLSCQAPERIVCYIQASGVFWRFFWRKHHFQFHGQLICKCDTFFILISFKRSWVLIGNEKFCWLVRGLSEHVIGWEKRGTSNQIIKTVISYCSTCCLFYGVAFGYGKCRQERKVWCLHTPCFLSWDKFGTWLQSNKGRNSVTSDCTFEHDIFVK